MKFSTREIQEKNGLKAAEAPEPAFFKSWALAGPMAGASVELEFSVGGSRILLTGRFKGAWALECARCLEGFEAPVDCSFEETFPLSEDSIDAGEELRQALVLAGPSKPLCRPDCKGLCPSCGKNLNEGPCGCDKGGPSQIRITRGRKI